MVTVPPPYLERHRTAQYLAEMLGQLRAMAQAAQLYDLAYLTALAEAEAMLHCAKTKD